MRAITFFLLLLLGACGDGQAPAEEVAPQSLSGTFFNAFFDELRGEPGANALKELKHFDQAGVSFDYPAVLRLRLDADEYNTWEMERADVELELHTPDFEVDAAGYIDLLADVLSSKKGPSEETLDGRTVEWCGQKITGVRRRINIFGDLHEYWGFDLPASPEGNRFIVFSDMLTDGKWSATATAAFDAVNTSIRCKDERDGKQTSNEAPVLSP